jgi:hypothetical protein
VTVSNPAFKDLLGSCFYSNKVGALNKLRDLMFSKDFKILQTHDFFFGIMKNNVFAFDMGVNITIIQQMISLISL